jgi:hypothetical protein
MLKKLDRFGVDFPFRVGNYQKFETKTGGAFFLIYLIGIFFYFTYGIYDYFYDSPYQRIIYDEDFHENEVNLKNQYFNFAIYDKDNTLLNNETIIKSYHQSNQSEINIPQKNCSKDEFSFDEFYNNKNPNLICFDNKENETITADTSLKHRVKYHIFPGINRIDNINKEISLVYTINCKNDNEIKKILGLKSFKIDYEIYYIYQFYLDKNIYINDDGIFFAKNETKIITNLDNFFITTVSRNKNDNISSLASIYIKQTNKVKYIYTKRKRLYSVILEMISMATTLLTNLTAIVIILNTKRAKQNIFENIFHLNSFQEDKINIPIEIEIQKIPNELNNKDLSERRNLQSFREDKINELNDNSKNDDDLFPKNELISLQIEPIQKRMERIQEIMKRNKIERIQREFHGRRNEIDDRNNQNPHDNNDLIELSINENIKKNENETREKMNMILNNYPTIKKNVDNKKDPRFVRNIFLYLYLLITCQRQRLKKVSKLNDIIDREFAESMNVFNFINRGKKLLIVENILFNQDERMLLDFISKPLINLEIDKEEKPIIDKLESKFIQDICNKYNNLQRKQNKTEIEKKLIDSFKNKINNN